jgi:RNA polymerase sigma-70 factor (ECF subfamily)
MEDQEIIELFFARSEQAITGLQGKYENRLMQIAWNILNNRFDAEECVNDAYLAVWNTIPPQKPEPLLTYVCHIVRNLSIKRYHANNAQKRNSHYDVALDELEECIQSKATVESEYAVKELAGEINRFLSTLNRENRIIFVRRYWFSDSIEDIAKMFNTSSKNISLRLLRIRQRLKKYLEKEGVWL